MGTVRRIVSIALFAGFLCMGCGSGGDNNDQGVSFRAVGLFIGDVSESKCTAPTTDKAIADAGLSLPLDLPQLDLGYPNVADAFFLESVLFSFSLDCSKIALGTVIKRGHI